MTNSDLNATFVWALALLLIATVTDVAVVRVVVSLPLVLFLAGHAVLRAIGITPQSFLTHAVYAIGASIALTLAGGFLLNLVSLLSPFGWGCWFVLVTGLAVIFGRRRPFPWDLGRLPQFHRVHAAAFGIAGVLMIAAFVQASFDEATTRQFSFTQFWMLPKTPGKLVIGIRNEEGKEQSFDVEVVTTPREKPISAEKNAESATGQVIADWHGIMVKPGDDWLREVDIAPGLGYNKVQATLYLSKDQTIYRRVSAITGSK